MRRRPVTCYFCDEVATSREHVPPKCLFPESKDLPSGDNLRRNLISVPSCESHNLSKSRDDEFLMWILAAPLQGNPEKQQHMLSKGMRAFNRAPDTFIAFMGNLTPVALQTPYGQLHESAAFEVDLARFDRCMCHIAAGLYHHHFGSRWRGTFRVVTDAFLAMRGPGAEQLNATMHDMSAKIERAFAGVPDRGENPKVFRYKLFSDPKNRHALHFTFYEGIRVSVALLDA